LAPITFEDEYDPHEAPDPKEWLDRPEEDRVRIVEDYHAGIELPNLRAHASVHVGVENQIAMGDELPVRRAVERLMGEGLDRHEAIHAVGSVLATYIHDVATGKISGETKPDPHHPYFAAVERLTAESWRRDYGEEGEPDAG
jgi:hypothetical protein